MGRVDGKVVLITGVARGQGRAHALRLAEEGADIVGVDLCHDLDTIPYPLSSSDDLQETAQLVQKAGGRMIARIADVRDRPALAAAVEAGVAEFGRLDGVVAQAAVLVMGSSDPSAFMDAATVGINGVINTVDVALPYLGAGASVVATGSLAAMMPSPTDNPQIGLGGLGYFFAKRTISSFINELAIALAPRKIRANVVHPTNCNTPMLHNEQMYKNFRPDLENPTHDDVIAAFEKTTALGVGYVEPEDVANAVLFLLSDEARYVTGMQMRVDAGGYVKLRPQLSPF